jgi:hypothetical protein
VDKIPQAVSEEDIFCKEWRLVVIAHDNSHMGYRPLFLEEVTVPTVYNSCASATNA